MNLPFVVLPGLTPEQVKKWDVQFASDGRNVAEGMWRRSHDAFTEATYGTALGDRRRRFVHFMDNYQIVDDGPDKNLAITESYIYICSTLPIKDALAYWTKHQKLATEHSWDISEWSNKKFHATLGDYEISGTWYTVHPHDKEQGTEFPADYRTVEVVFRSRNEAFDKSKRESPWEVWQKTYHRPGPRENARVVTDLSELEQYFPMHIELGGGPSIEAGIPPLNFFHHTYSAYSQSNGGFAFGETDTLLERLIVDLPAFFAEAIKPYKMCFLAKPTEFYRFLAELRDDGLTLEPLINNNFDGLAKIVGYKENYIRRYGRITFRPDIEFDPSAKALLVVGLHSDRRLVRERARECGLKVIIVDPEKCFDKNGNTKPYPLEDVKSDDLLVHMGANEFAAEMKKVLATTPVLSPDNHSSEPDLFLVS